MTRTYLYMASALLAAAAAGRQPLAAAQIVVNGGFEGSFSGWTIVNQTGSEGTFFLQSGNTSPANGDPVPVPPQGNFAAMTDAQGPGSHVLYQDLFIPSNPGPSILSFSVFIGNRAPAFYTPSNLDFATSVLNQQARVDILRPGANAFSVAAADILYSAYATVPGDPLVLPGYLTITRDVTAVLAANAGQTLRLRFAEVDNVFSFQLGIDQVSLETAAEPIPEPSTLGTGALVLALAWMGRNRFR